VDKFLLSGCNEPENKPSGLDAKGVLPTMKSQLSQLPLLVGLWARQQLTRPFFMSFTFLNQPLKRFD
jgi:hypothetical protein